MPPYSYFTNKTLGNLTYYIYDHLGNTRVTYKPNVSCSNGAVSYTLESVLDYYPYSKLLREFRAGVAEKYQSTGNERDIETGWDFRNRRNSDADIGRFLQIDPKFELNPQWSSYVYTNDNPALLIDPNGDCPPGTPCWQFQQGVAQGVIGGAKGTLTGMWNLATSPLETGKAIGNAIMNYEQTWESAKGAVIEQYGKATSGNPQAMGEVVGGAAFAVVEAIAGTKGVTKLGSMGKAGEVVNVTEDIAGAAKSSVNAVKLNKQLASEAQLSESGSNLAGQGTKTPLRKAGELSKQYGGDESDWVKKSSSSHIAPDGKKFSTHWEENLKTGFRVNQKTKFDSYENKMPQK